MLTNRIPRAALAAVLLASWTLPALAAEKADATEERPWAADVSKEDQAQALVLFKEGNALLKDSVFVQAAQKYREALQHWDHPAIHYNLVLALLNLDQPIEVHEHLVAAMKYGPAPLDLEKYEQARAYKVLVEKQLARVEISCAVDGAQVVMDGRPLFTAPGRYDGLVRPGPHSIVATKEGYLTNEISRALPAGEITALDIDLFKATDLTRYRRRWAAWMPWTVLGTGAAVALGGGALHYGALQSFDEFDQGVTACDRTTGGGCILPTDLAATRDRGFLMQNVALGSYVLGGAALVTGAVLVFLNRPQAYQVAPDGKPVPADETNLTLAPMIGGDTRGVAMVLRF